jgi:hypothetical protein
MGHETFGDVPEENHASCGGSSAPGDDQIGATPSD